MKLTAIVLAFLSSTLFFTDSKTLKVNQQKTTLIWVGSDATGGYKPEGTLKLLNGEISLTKEKLGSIQLTFDMKSITHDNSDLQNHLKNEDFFVVEKYPKAKFVSTKITKQSNDSYIIEGDLTIKNFTKTETIFVELKNDKEEYSLIFDAKIDRTKYGVTFNSPTIFEKLKENAIADDFTFKGEIYFE